MIVAVWNAAAGPIPEATPSVSMTGSTATPSSPPTRASAWRSSQP